MKKVFLSLWLSSLCILGALFLFVKSGNAAIPSDQNPDPNFYCFVDWEVPEVYSSLDLIGVDCKTCEPVIMHNRNNNTTKHECDETPIE